MRYPCISPEAVCMGIIHDVVCVPLELLIMCQCVDPLDIARGGILGVVHWANFECLYELRV